MNASSRRALVWLVATVALLALLWPLTSASAQPQDLAARDRAASQAMSEGRYDDAARLYSELLKALPDEPGLLMNLGMALAMGGREQEAIAPLERAVKLNPKLVPAHLFLGSSYLAQQEAAKAIPPLERVVKAQPADIESRRMLAQAYLGAERTVDAVAQLRRITQIDPKLPAAWYALGHAYNTLTQEAIATFHEEPEDSPWRQLLLADALQADGRLTDAFALYRRVQEQLPSMVTIHDSLARIYELTEHPGWAAVERKRGALASAECVKRKALCEFRAGRHRESLAAALAAGDRESRYWRTRAATELALAAFNQLEKLPDSRERREVRGMFARAQRRYLDAIAELKAALALAPGDPGLLDDLGTSYYLARDYEQAIATLRPVIDRHPDDGRLQRIYGDSLLQLQRPDEAIPHLRRAVDLDPADSAAVIALGRALVQKGEFAAAIPLLERHLADDHDGSVHVQLGRAYAATGQQEKSNALLQRAQELQREAQTRADATAQRTITPPK